MNSVGYNDEYSNTGILWVGLNDNLMEQLAMNDQLFFIYLQMAQVQAQQCHSHSQIFSQHK